MSCSRIMATPMFEQGLTLEDVLELSADELRDELAGRDIDAKGMSKVEMQKAFICVMSTSSNGGTSLITPDKRKQSFWIGSVTTGRFLSRRLRFI